MLDAESYYAMRRPHFLRTLVKLFMRPRGRGRSYPAISYAKQARRGLR